MSGQLQPVPYALQNDANYADRCDGYVAQHGRREGVHVYSFGKYILQWDSKELRTDNRQNRDVLHYIAGYNQPDVLAFHSNTNRARHSKYNHTGIQP